MSSKGMSSAAFILSLLGGIFIVIGSILSSMWFVFGTLSYGGMMGGYDGFGGMMRGYQGMMGTLGAPLGFIGPFTLIALVCGITVIVGAIMLNVQPREHMAWAIVILIFSIISLLGMGGFFIGAALGIAGGAIALSYRNQP